MKDDETMPEQNIQNLGEQEFRQLAPEATMNESPVEKNLRQPSETGDFFRTAIIAVLLALLIRTFLYEPFNIPSGSMKPTLEVGDYLFVSKPSYGYSRYSFPFGVVPVEGRLWDKEPQRGDVIVFRLPTNTQIDYIKRLVGLPGDKIHMKKGRLYINDVMIPREPVGLKKIEDDYNGAITVMEYIETLPGGVMHRIYEESDDGPLDNTDPFVVPDGHYFMMGDNRDHSQDSRVTQSVGFVPYENLVGRADFLFFSTNGYANLGEIWKWPWTVRYDRLFMGIGPVRPDSEPVAGDNDGDKKKEG